MTRVAVITGDPVGARMAGPAIRAWHMAGVLTAAGHEVRLVTTTRLDEVPAPFGLSVLLPGDDRGFAALEAWADVVVFQGHAMSQFPALRATAKPVVADVYDPMHLEMLEQGRELGRGTWELRVATATAVLNEQLALADFFLVASARQRAFFLGQLAALGRLTPATYADDPHLERLIAIAPFGLSAQQPQHRRQVLKGVVEGIGPDDRVVLWGGGVYSWFDPLTLIRAIDQLAQRRPSVRLFFLGTRHPGVDEMGIVREAHDLAVELGAEGRTVFFNDDWVEYDARQEYLAEADAGVSTHFAHIETEFAFRTRILDYLWAGLPMVVTEGDSFAELVAAEGLGVVVPPRDVDALADALERVLFDEAFAAAARERIAVVRERFVWERALAPLVQFVADPHHAADWTGRREPKGALGGTRKPHGLRHDLRMAWHFLRNGGPGVVLAKVRGRLGRRG